MPHKGSYKGKGGNKIKKVFGEFKRGTLKSSSGKKITSHKQATAIALSEARQAGAKIPKKGKSMKGRIKHKGKIVF